MTATNYACNEQISSARSKSIIEYLDSLGLPSEKRSGLLFFKSPFSVDKTYSLCIYPNNSFFDFSSGFGGDIIELVMRLESLKFNETVLKLCANQLNNFKINLDLPERDRSVKKININSFLTKKEDYVAKIEEYAKSRHIYSGYEYSKFFKKIGDNWETYPALGFIHRNDDLDVCGIRMRNIDRSSSDRFKGKGNMHFYILENILDDDPILIFSESETSSNSLWQYMKDNLISGVVLSFGGVARSPSTIPYKYRGFKKRKIIIDFDGSEKLYQERLIIHKDLGDPVKLELPKGEDINSLYIKNELVMFENQIFC